MKSQWILIERLRSCFAKSVKHIWTLRVLVMANVRLEVEGFCFLVDTPFRSKLATVMILANIPNGRHIVRNVQTNSQ